MRHYLTLITAFVLMACGSETTVEVPEPTLSDIQAKVFTPSCAISGCHNANAEGGLDLRAGQSYANLVSVPAQKSKEDLLRVKPGDANNSFLIRKLVRPAGGEGTLMPQGRPEGLDAEVIEAIKTWINNGAQNN